MFGLSSFKLIAIGLAALFIAAVVGAGYRYVTVMQETIRVLEANNAKLETAVDQQKGAITALETTIQERDARAESFAQTLADLAERQTRNRAELDQLNSTLAKHDLERLADEKPQLVETRINRGTRDVIRLLNAASAIGGVDEAGRGRPGAAPAAATSSTAPAR